MQCDVSRFCWSNVSRRRNRHTLLPKLFGPDGACQNPKIGGLPELRTYRCIVCEEVMTIEHED